MKNTKVIEFKALHPKDSNFVLFTYMKRCFSGPIMRWFTIEEFNKFLAVMGHKFNCMYTRIKDTESSYDYEIWGKRK